MIQPTNVSPITDFKRHTPEFVRRLKATGLPEVLTIEGRGELVVQDAAAYQRLLEIVDRAQAVAGVRRGLADLATGGHWSAAEFEAAMRARFGIPKDAQRVRRRVRATESALADADVIDWIRQQASDRSAHRRFNAWMRQVHALAVLPHGRARAVEAGVVPGVELRQFVSGSFRPIYTVVGASVFVLHLRRAARRPATPTDLNAALDEVATDGTWRTA